MMNGRTLRQPRLTWLIILAASIAAYVWIAFLPANYDQHHEWPVLVGLAALVFGIYGAATLFWSAVPRQHTAKVFFYLGIGLMLLCWLAVPSLAGVIVGAVATLIGAALMVLQAQTR